MKRTVRATFLAAAMCAPAAQSGMTMSAVTLMAGSADAGGVGAMSDQSGREQILGDGPKQSGGRRIEVPSTGAFPKALQASSRTSASASVPSAVA